MTSFATIHANRHAAIQAGREDQPFGEQATDDAETRGAERLPQRDLALPDDGARNEQVGDVGAHDRDRQHRDDREDREHPVPCIATMLLPPAVAEYGTSRNLTL